MILKEDAIQFFQDDFSLLVWATYDDTVDLLCAQRWDTLLVQLFHHIGTSPYSSSLFGFYFHQHSIDYMLAQRFPSQTCCHDTHHEMTLILKLMMSWCYVVVRKNRVSIHFFQVRLVSFVAWTKAGNVPSLLLLVTDVSNIHHPIPKIPCRI